MKKLVIMAGLLMAAMSLKAQEGEILYTEFDPPLYFQVDHIGGWSEDVLIDIDYDGATDYRLTTYFMKGDVCIQQQTLNTTAFRTVDLSGENDTIPALGGWRNEEILFCWNGLDVYFEKIGIQKVIDGKKYYGWIHRYGSEELHFPFKKWVYIDKMAFCTIPDYPLVWGQTSLTGIDESTESVAFATLHPNPTTGMVTVTGENLRQAEVFNMLGQLVLTALGKGNGIYIDMTDLPAGVYFVDVTDEEGRKCVRKVVKE